MLFSKFKSLIIESNNRKKVLQELEKMGLCNCIEQALINTDFKWHEEDKVVDAGKILLYIKTTPYHCHYNQDKKNENTCNGKYGCSIHCKFRNTKTEAS